MKIPQRGFLRIAFAAVLTQLVFGTPAAWAKKAEVVSPAPLNEAKLASTITPPEGKTVAQIKAAVLIALSRHSWNIQDQTDNTVFCTHSVKRVIVNLTVKFDTQKIEIWSRGSGPVAAEQKKETAWIAYIVKDITDTLAGVGLQPAAAPTKDAAAPANDTVVPAKEA